jgi:hypothetical protein
VARLAAGMAELNAGDRILLLDEFDEAAQRLDEFIVPDAEIAKRAAAAAFYFCGFTTTRPAPAANLPAFIRCQSVGKPFTAEYWCIGGTTLRLRSARPRMVSGENSSTSFMADPGQIWSIAAF